MLKLSSMKYITAKQYKQIKDIPRGRLAARYLVYVGAIIIKDGMILLCQPIESKYPGWQLPGGKVLWSELLSESLKREIYEETGLSVELDKVVGIYQRETTAEDEEYLRIIYRIKSFTKKKNRPLDPEIKEMKWFNIKEVIEGKINLQTLQIIKEIKDSQKELFSLNVIKKYKW